MYVCKIRFIKWSLRANNKPRATFILASTVWYEIFAAGFHFCDVFPLPPEQIAKFIYFLYPLSPRQKPSMNLGAHNCITPACKSSSLITLYLKDTKIFVLEGLGNGPNRFHTNGFAADGFVALALCDELAIINVSFKDSLKVYIPCSTKFLEKFNFADWRFFAPCRNSCSYKHK